MAIIPHKAYKVTEYNLTNAPNLLRWALADEEAAHETLLSLPGSGWGNGEIKGKGNHSSTVERTAIALAGYGEKVTRAKAWQSIADEIRIMFPPGSPEGDFFEGYFVQHMTIADIVAATTLERQTAYNYRDKIVINAALLAAECGLIKIKQTQEG